MKMELKILHLKPGAQQARGLVVIIDVFRAFTVAPYLFKNNAARVIPVALVEEAFALQKELPGSILIGERFEDKVPGFDFGNSPSTIKNVDLSGKTVVHTTSSGTQGIINATQADEILTGSFVNADAIVEYIRQRKPKTVSLVCMGYACQYEVEEDTFCAKYIEAKILGREFDFAAIKEIIRETSGARFFDPAKAHFAPSSDFEMCMQTGVFNFVLRVKPWKNGFVELEKIDIE